MSTDASRRQTDRRLRMRCEAGGGAPVAWLVGDWDAGEFTGLRGVLDPTREWAAMTTLDAATANAALQTAPPEVLLLSQPRQGCIEQTAIDRVLAVSPLVRVVVVAGSWCEGELRTGKPLVGAVRLYWHELPAWWARSLERQRAGLAPLWSGPSREDAAEDFAERGTIAVDANDFAAFEAIEASLGPHGFQCVWTPRGRGAVGEATAGIWDGGQLDGDEQASLAAFCRRLDGDRPRVVALVDYPRAEHVAIVHAAGAAGALGKPYSVSSLVHELLLTRRR